MLPRLLRIAAIGMFVANPAWAESTAPVLTDGVSTMSIDAVRLEILALPPEVRGRIAGDRNQVANLVANALADMRVEAAGRAAALTELPEVKARIAKSTQAIIVKKYLEDAFARLEAALPDFTVQAKEIYATNRTTYVIPEAIQAAHILFKVDPENDAVTETDAEIKVKAEAILKELRGGADFAAAVRKYSGDQGTLSTDGRLKAWMPRGSLVPPFEKLAYSLKPGELGGPVRTRFGYHLIKLLDHRPARSQEFEEVKASIIDKIKKDYLAEKRKAILAPFAGAKAVAIDDAAWAALQSP